MSWMAETSRAMTTKRIVVLSQSTSIPVMSEQREIAPRMTHQRVMGRAMPRRFSQTASWRFARARRRLYLDQLSGSPTTEQASRIYHSHVRLSEWQAREFVAPLGMWSRVCCAQPAAGGTRLVMAQIKPASSRAIAAVTKLVRLAAAGELAIAGAQPQLRLPGDLSDWPGLRFLSASQLETDPVRETVTPGFDQQPAGCAVAGLGEAAVFDTRTARMLGWRQSEVGHQLARIGKTRQVAQFGDKRCRVDQDHATHRL
jgi:hypothetical protein